MWVKNYWCMICSSLINHHLIISESVLNCKPVDLFVISFLVNVFSYQSSIMYFVGFKI